MMEHPQITWFLPTCYGDIRLDSVDGLACKVTLTKLSPREVEAMRELRYHSTRKWGRKWATDEQWNRLPQRAYEQGHAEESTIVLQAEVQDVEKILTKALRADRQVVRCVRIADGKVEEVSEAKYPEIVRSTQAVQEDGRTTQAEILPAERRPLVGTTVAKPEIGCPAPDFEAVHLRATRVLKTFLTPEQIEDFDKYQRFVTVGVDTGHRYMITSRNAKTSLSRFQRTVYDLDEQRPYCVHDWDIPAPEEMLTMHALLSMRGHEAYVRGEADEGFRRADALQMPPVLPVKRPKAVKVRRG